MTRDNLVSVIVPTKNSAETLEACLNSIKNQTYKNIETIVVDNNSLDQTQKIAQSLADKVYIQGPERSAQRNFGVKKSQGKYLLILDSDMVLTEKVAEECVAQINKDEETKALVIPEVSVGEGFWAKCKALEKECYLGDETIEAARFFDRKTFFKFNGYDEEIHGGGEEWDLPLRIKKAGYKIGRINSLAKHLEGNLRLIETIKTKHYYAKTVSKYIKKHPEMARKQFKLIRPAFIRNWRKLAKDPLHTAGFIFMKFCEFGAGELGLVKSKLENR